MAEMVDLSRDPLSSLNRICHISTQQEREILSDQSKTMIESSKRSYERRNTSKVCSRCWKMGHM